VVKRLVANEKIGVRFSLSAPVQITTKDPAGSFVVLKRIIRTHEHFSFGHEFYKSPLLEGSREIWGKLCGYVDIGQSLIRYNRAEYIQYRYFKPKI
jgi:hypothetical protein